MNVELEGRGKRIAEGSSIKPKKVTDVSRGQRGGRDTRKKMGSYTCFDKTYRRSRKTRQGDLEGNNTGLEDPEISRAS